MSNISYYCCFDCIFSSNIRPKKTKNQSLKFQRSLRLLHIYMPATHHHFVFTQTWLQVLNAGLFCDPFSQDIILHSWQDAWQSVCFHLPEPTEWDAGVPRVPLCQTESGECLMLSLWKLWIFPSTQRLLTGTKGVKLSMKKEDSFSEWLTRSLSLCWKDMLFFSA